MPTKPVINGAKLFIPNKTRDKPDPPSPDSYGTDMRAIEAWGRTLQYTAGTGAGTYFYCTEVLADIPTTTKGHYTWTITWTSGTIQKDSTDVSLGTPATHVEINTSGVYAIACEMGWFANGALGTPVHIAQWVGEGIITGATIVAGSDLNFLSPIRAWIGYSFRLGITVWQGHLYVVATCYLAAGDVLTFTEGFRTAHTSDVGDQFSGNVSSLYLRRLP